MRKSNTYGEYKTIVEKTTAEINRLINKYQENPKKLIEDYDKMLNELIIAIIANWNLYTNLRDDIVTYLDRLFIIREKIANNYCNESSNNNND